VFRRPKFHTISAQYASLLRPTGPVDVTSGALFLGIDGGGTRCRARLASASGERLAEATAGPANIRTGLPQAFAAILEVSLACLREAGLPPRALARTTACLGLAGASEPADLAAAQRRRHPFGHTFVTSDAHAACVGAHAGRDGAIIVVGTGSIGWAELNGRHYRVGGWGLPMSDEGSGAWLGCEALRRVLWARDARVPWTGLLAALYEDFQADPHVIVRWAAGAGPRDFAALAPRVVEHAAADDAVAVELMRLAASHVDALAARLAAFGAERLALTGGLAASIAPWLAPGTSRLLVTPEGDALDGALRLAREAHAEAEATKPRRRRA
jgi:glucosamine kinase